MKPFGFGGKGDATLKETFARLFRELEDLSQSQRALTDAVARNTRTVELLLARLDKETAGAPVGQAATPPAAPTSPPSGLAPLRMRRRGDIRDFAPLGEEKVLLLEIDGHGDVNFQKPGATGATTNPERSDT